MKTLKQTFFVTIFALVAISCKENKATQTEETQAIEQDTTNTIVANPKTASFEIEGMTCAVGCAGLIENKLNKLEGVSDAKVDFETKTATVTYDGDKLDQEKLTKTVEGVAGGDLYKVSKIKS